MSDDRMRHSFDGKPLIHWLREFVKPGRESQVAAANAIYEIHQACMTEAGPGASEIRGPDHPFRQAFSTALLELGDARETHELILALLRLWQDAHILFQERVGFRVKERMIDPPFWKIAPTIPALAGNQFLAWGEELQRRDFDSVWIVAGRTIPQMGPAAAAALPEIAAFLKSPYVSVRHGAGEMLEGLGAAAAPETDALFEEMRVRGPNEWPYRVGLALASVAAENPAVLARLIASLDPAQPKLCRAAAATLWIIGPPARAAIPSLLAATKDATDPQLEVAHQAISALGRIAIGEPAVADALLPLVAHEAWWIRGSALRSLGSIGCRVEDVLPLAIAALADTEGCDWTVQDGALDAIAAMGPRAAAATAEVAKLLRDECQETRNGAIQALGAIGPAAREAVPALRELPRSLDPEDSPGMCKLIAKAIANIEA